MKTNLEEIKAHFEKFIKKQLECMETNKKEEDWIDFNVLKPIIMGIIKRDGTGKYVTKYAKNLLEFILQDEIMNGYLWNL